MATSTIKKEPNATTSLAGLMSAADKTKLNGIKTLSEKTASGNTTSAGNISLGLSVSSNIVLAVANASDSATFCNVTPYLTGDGNWYGHCVSAADNPLESKSVKLRVWYLH